MRRPSGLARVLARSTLISAVITGIAFASPSASADDAATNTPPEAVTTETAKPDTKPAEPKPDVAATKPSDTAQSAPDQPAKASPFKPGATVKLTCQTDAMGVRHAPPKSTHGRVYLELTMSDAADKTGQWTVTAFDTENKESFAAYLKKNDMCGKDRCPLRLTEEIGAELWAPKPMSIDKLNKNDLLVLITLNEKTLELKSSTFQGADQGAAPLVFEKGTCEKTP